MLFRSMYCAYQGEDDYTKISPADLSAQVQAHRTEYYGYTTSEEVRTEPVQKEVRGQTITVQEDHTYTVFALSYVGDDYFADTVWQLDDRQKNYADAYAHNLTVYLHEIEEHEGISILGQINDALIDDDSPAPGGGFGNPFNDPNWEQHITSFFGKREDVGIPGKDTTNHNGLDIAYPYGTPILAVEAGTVIKAGYHVSYGNYLVINHGGGYCTLYAHCSQLLAQVQPHDILKFGIIPELVGRLPVIAPLNALQREDLVRILQEPKNALVKQYKKLLEYDDVDLEFTEDALNAIADKAIERNIGARGLRAVMEGLLTKVMYEIPSDETVVKAVVTKECVEGTAEPELTHDPNKINYSVKLNPGRSESRSESGTPKSAS